jgi:septal ring factor EnvC (AmiA/AmiB activator)
LNNRISQRNELLATLKKELELLDTKIQVNEQTVSKLSKELVALKKEYAKVIYFAYKNQSDYSKLIYLFSSEDLNQAYQRWRYIEQVSSYLRNEAENIKNTEAVKTAELEELNQQKNEKNLLLDKENLQVSKLEQEKVQKDKLVKNLSGKEKQLQADLKAKEKESRQLQKKIEDIIARETKPKNEASGSGTYEMTPAEKELSTSFSSNMGKLPWPIEKGMISETFGVHQHPVLKNVKTKNNGIDIATSPGTKVRSVFDGVVVSVVPITTTNIAVIIKHGDYFTVYSNLDEVFVKQGEKVKTKEEIGAVHTSLKGITELHFEVWKEKTLQNPSKWIVPAK